MQQDTVDPPLLSVRDLTVAFTTRRGTFDAVSDITFDVTAGKILGIVGESGSGKSVTAMALMGLLPENARVTGGQIIFAGRDLTRLPESEFRRVRGSAIGIVFQDPTGCAFHPRCPYAWADCTRLLPPRTPVDPASRPGHDAACLRHTAIAACP